MARQAYSLLGNDRRARIEIPEYNYRAGELKAKCYQSGWYIPSERRWEKYQNHRFLPPLASRDAIDFSREEDYMKFKRRTNTVNGRLYAQLPILQIKTF